MQGVLPGAPPQLNHLPQIDGDKRGIFQEEQDRPLECLRRAFVIFVGTLAKTINVLIAVVLFVWVYYLPSCVLTPELLDTLTPILYEDILSLFRLLSFWFSIGLAATEIFTTQFTKRAIFCALIPGSAVEMMIRLSREIIDHSFTSNIAFANAFFFLGIGLFVIYKSQKPEDMPATEEVNYNLTKDGTVMSLFKGLVGFFVFVAFFSFNIIPVYLDSDFMKQLIFRFIVFPVCFSVSNWYQNRVVFNLSKGEMDRRLVANKLCNYYIQFTGRILISNLSTSGARSYQFILVNLANSMSEFASTLSFTYRTRLLHRVTKKCDKIYRTHLIHTRQAKVVPVAPADSQPHPNANNVEERKDVDEEKYINDSIKFRARYIFDFICSEMYAVLLAPLLMYFLHPFVSKSSKFQTIQSFEECFYQIFVQMIFEIMVDICSLAYEVYKKNITMEDLENWKPLYGPLLFNMSVFCLLSMHYHVLQNA